jgi:hypothetical protein
MSLLNPCSFCGERRVGEKLSNATWAWWRADNVRVAYRQRLCVGCYVTNVAGLETSCGSDPYDCPVCHTEPGEAMDPTYLTIFVPAYGPLRLEMATCGPCAVEVRNRGQVGARKLDNQQPESGGQDPGPQTDPALAAWRALGILPRE